MMRTSGPLPGEPVEEAPGETPVCPGCGAVAEYVSDTVAGIECWFWLTTHSDDCTWLADPDSEPY